LFDVFFCPFILSLFFFNLGRSLGESYLGIAVHCKKRLAIFPWLVTSRLGTGKSLTFFTVYCVTFSFILCLLFWQRSQAARKIHVFEMCWLHTLLVSKPTWNILYLLKGKLQYTVLVSYLSTLLHDLVHSF
jgi:hypothetical protein